PRHSLFPYTTLFRSARWPNTTIALSHACLPLERSADQLAEWTQAMRRLAMAPNVVVKISAVAGASDPDWTIASIRPWILSCVEVDRKSTRLNSSHLG